MQPVSRNRGPDEGAKTKNDGSPHCKNAIPLVPRGKCVYAPSEPLCSEGAALTRRSQRRQVKNKGTRAFEHYCRLLGTPATRSAKALKNRLEAE